MDGFEFENCGNAVELVFFVFTNVGYVSIFKIVNFFTIQKILPKMGFAPIRLSPKDFKSFMSY